MDRDVLLATIEEGWEQRAELSPAIRRPDELGVAVERMPGRTGDPAGSWVAEPGGPAG